MSLQELIPVPLNHPVLMVSVFMLGACVGSFLNVCIYRIPKEKSVIWPGSFCYGCDTAIKWYDNLPILSWFILKGKCRKCSATFSMRYALIELFVGLVFLALWWKFYDEPAVAGIYMTMAGLLVMGSFIDIDERWLPDRVTIGMIVFGPILSMLVPQLHGEYTALNALIASLVGLGAGYWALSFIAGLGKAIFRKEAMGYGDVKLVAGLGAILGPAAVLWIVFSASVLGTIFGLAMMLLFKGKSLTPEAREAGLKTLLAEQDKISKESQALIAGLNTDNDENFHKGITGLQDLQEKLYALHAQCEQTLMPVEKNKLPFGPYLAVGALLWLFGGSELVDWYLSTIFG